VKRVEDLLMGAPSEITSKQLRAAYPAGNAEKGDFRPGLICHNPSSIFF
jgi:hypothetical protein